MPGLYHKARRALVRAAKERNIDLRQNYERVGKVALIMQGRYAHARQLKRAKTTNPETAHLPGTGHPRHQTQMPGARRNSFPPADHLRADLQPDQEGPHKVYSVHAPEVECIAKGKAHTKYEFGCKVAMVTSSLKNWVLAIDALHGNPF